MKDPMWLTVAKTLPAERSRRVLCCSKDRSMLVTNGQHGYRGHCFRCGAKPFVAHGLFSVEQLARRKREQAFMEDRTVRLPADFTLDIPTGEAVWLYKAGVSAELAKHYRFGYSAMLRRVILPVYSGNTLIGFTARSTINERPKYIEKVSSPTETIFVADATTVLPSASAWAAAGGPDLVFTEDILSAVRVGRNVRRCVSLMGTSASAPQVSAGLASLGPDTGVRLAVWLDGDKAGRLAASRLTRTLRMQGYTVLNIESPKDPKLYSNKEIQEWLT